MLSERDFPTHHLIIRLTSFIFYRLQILGFLPFSSVLYCYPCRPVCCVRSKRANGIAKGSARSMEGESSHSPRKAQSIAPAPVQPQPQGTISARSPPPPTPPPRISLGSMKLRRDRSCLHICASAPGPASALLQLLYNPGPALTLASLLQKRAASSSRQLHC